MSTATVSGFLDINNLGAPFDDLALKVWSGMILEAYLDGRPNDRLRAFALARVQYDPARIGQRALVLLAVFALQQRVGLRQHACRAQHLVAHALRNHRLIFAFDGYDGHES